MNSIINRLEISIYLHHYIIILMMMSMMSTVSIRHRCTTCYSIDEEIIKHSELVHLWSELRVGPVVTIC